MQPIDFKMINNTKRIAETKLNLHRNKGEKSPLSIFEVADLMDLIHRADAMSHVNNEPSIFHSMAYN